MTAARQRTTADEGEAAELERLGYVCIGVNDTGEQVFVPPLPRVEARVPIDSVTHAQLLAGQQLEIDGGTADHMHAQLSSAVRCVNCQGGPKLGEMWIVILDTDPLSAQWRHDGCPR